MVDLCIHLAERSKYPAADNVVALKMLAEADERAFNGLANEHGVVERPRVLPRAACA